MKFPKIPTDLVVPLGILVNLLRKDPNILVHHDHPYTDTALEIAELLGKGVQVEEGVSPVVEEGIEVIDVKELAPTENLFHGDGDSWEKILGQTEMIYSSLVLLQDKVNKSNKANPNQVITFYKNLTTLLEKIISLKERGTEAKEVHDFKNAILEVFDNVLTADQRNLALEILGGEYEPKLSSSESIVPVLPSNLPDSTVKPPVSSRNRFINAENQ